MVRRASELTSRERSGIPTREANPKNLDVFGTIGKWSLIKDSLKF